MQYLLKFQRHFFFQKQEDILNYVSNFKVPQRTKTILKTRNKFGGDHSSLFQNMLQNYSKQKRAVLTLRQKYKPREQKGWPRNHGVRGYMVFDKGVKITLLTKISSSFARWKSSGERSVAEQHKPNQHY